MIMIRSICEHCKHCLSCMCGDEFKDCKLKKSKKDGDIDERAVAFGEMLLSYGESEDSASSGASGYMIGARTQRAIDIVRIREWLEKNIRHYIEPASYSKVDEVGVTRMEVIACVDAQLFDDIQKMMEG